MNINENMDYTTNNSSLASSLGSGMYLPSFAYPKVADIEANSIENVEDNTADDNMTSKRSWDEFSNSGLLWFINTILQLFGWSIVMDIDEETGEVLDVYPARSKFRGFSEDVNDNGYTNVTKYLKENIDELLKEAEGK